MRVPQDNTRAPRGFWWDGDNFSADLRGINRRRGLIWSCTDFRHTFGSHLAMKGESRYKISALMGNSPEVCRKHYAALLPESPADSVEFHHPASPAGDVSMEPTTKTTTIVKPACPPGWRIVGLG